MSWNTFLDWLRSLVSSFGKRSARRRLRRSLPRPSFRPQIDCVLEDRVVPTATYLALTPSVNPAFAGQSVDFVATITADDNSNPTGPVDFYTNGSWLGRATLGVVNGNDQATLAGISFPSGSDILYAAFAGDSTYDPSTSDTLTETVTTTATTTSLSTDVNPAVVGQTVTLSATVAPQSPSTGIPTGTVTFSDGSTALGSATLDGNGVATLPLRTLSLGSHSLAASYAGDDSYLSSSTAASLSETINPAATTTSLTASPTPSGLGQTAILTATVAPQSPGSGIPTGTVTFFDGSTALGSGTLDSSGTATLSINTLSLGTHVLSAGYSGDSNYTNSTSANYTQQVQLATTVTLASAAPNPSTYSQSATFTATVSPAATNLYTPSGAVSFYDGSSLIGQAPLNGSPGNDQASLTFAGLDAGTHPITAVYTGDSVFASSTSDSLSQVVQPATTSTGLSVDVSSAVYGQPVTLTALVTDQGPGTATPTGTVVFAVWDPSNGGSWVSLGSAAVQSDGSAVLTLTGLSLGSYDIRANYQGTTDFVSSTSPAVLADGATLSVQVSPASTSTALSVDVNPSVFGQTLTFTATVTAPSPSTATPSGTIRFYGQDLADPTQWDLLGTATLDASGVAQVSTATLVSATHTLYASYSGTTNFTASASGTLSQVVNPAATATSFSADVNPAVFGQTVTVTLAVAAQSPGAGIPTGTVTLFDGSTSLGSATLDNTGSATLPVNSLSVGNHGLWASYGGDANFIASSSAPSIETIHPASSSTSLSADVNPAVIGQTVTLSASVNAVSPGAGIPTGTVTWYDGNTMLGSGTLDSSGTATFQTSTLSLGNHALTVSYAGDSNFTSSTSAAYSEVVQRATSVTVTSSSPNPSTYGQAVTFSATVNVSSPGAGTATGNVGFYEGTTLLGTASLNQSSPDVATFSFAALGAGTHTITAVYQGDTNFASSQGSTDQAVALSATTTNLILSPAPSVFGQAVTFTASVSAMSPGAGIPTGAVTFFDGSTSLGSATLDSNGVATFLTSALGLGSHAALTATYNGDANFTGSTSGASTQTVNQAASVTTVRADINPAVVGQSVTFTVTVAAQSPGSGLPTGMVSFTEGSTVLGSGTLNGNGTRTFTVCFATAGTHSLSFDYAGDTDFTNSSSGAFTQIVNPAATRTSLRADVNPAVVGQTVTFTLAVAAQNPGAGIPTGTVTLFDGSTSLGSATLDNTGTATVQTNALSLGDHSDLTASYSGDGNYTSSTSDAYDELVRQATSVTVTSSSPNPSTYGQDVIFTATVSPHSPASGVATGTVNFYEGTTLLGAGTLDQNNPDVATLDLASLAAGTHTVTAYYQGDANFAGSHGSTMQTVTQSGTSLGFSWNPSSASFGDTEALTVTASAVSPGAGTPTGTVTLRQGSTTLGSATLDYTGTATFQTGLSGGSHTLTVSYGGDSNFTSSSATTGYQVSPLASITMAGSSPNDSIYGQTVTFTATVSNAANWGVGTPTGSVTFSENGNTLGTATLDSSGTVTFNDPWLPAGTHDISVTYSGDNNFNPSSTDISQTVDPAPTSTTLTVNQDPSGVGQSVTFTATVSSGSPVLEGTVDFVADGWIDLGSASLDSTGTATVQTSDLDFGTHRIVATYGGTSNYDSSSDALSQNVLQAATLALTVSPTTASVFGQSLTYTATVSPVDPDNGTPTGTVQFFDGSTLLHTGILDSNGQASYSISSLSVATHTIRAVYGGDAIFGGYTIALTQTVNKAATSTTLAASPSPSVFGQGVTLSADVTITAPGAGTLTGTVTFKDGNTALGTVTLASNGTATLTVSSLGAAPHALTATYNGDVHFRSSTGSAGLTVQQAATTTTLTSSLNPSLRYQAVTFTATVAAQNPGAGTTTGTVSFYDGSTLLGTGTLNSSGVATFQTSALHGGTRSITAQYGGDSNFSGSTSSSLTQIVNGAPSSIAVSEDVNTSQYGQTVTLTGTVSGSGGQPGGTVTFFDGSTPLGTATLNSSGVATLHTHSLGGGSHTLGAHYNGDDSYAVSDAGTVGQTVTPAPTTAVLTSDVDPAVFGQTVTFTAVITGGGDSPASGTVDFYDGDTLLGTGALSGGTATYPTSTLTLGIHYYLTAVYAGDANYTGSTAAPYAQEIDPAPTRTTLTTDVDPSVYGQKVTLTAQVTVPSPGAGDPTGKVDFYDGNTKLSTVTLDGFGMAKWQTTSFDVGTHLLSAVYEGELDFLTSTSAIDPQVVNKAATTVPGFSGSAPYSWIDSSIPSPGVSIGVTVQAPGAGAPGGAVDVTFDGQDLGHFTVGNGTATITLAGLVPIDVGTHTLSAVYLGDSHFLGSSGSGTLTITKSDTDVSVGLGNCTSGPTFTASVTATYAPGHSALGLGPTGTVTLYRNGSLLATATLVPGTGLIDPSQVRSFATFNLDPSVVFNVGDVISATYSGDARYNGSSGEYRPGAGSPGDSNSDPSTYKPPLGIENPNSAPNLLVGGQGSGTGGTGLPAYQLTVGEAQVDLSTGDLELRQPLDISQSDAGRAFDSPSLVYNSATLTGGPPQLTFSVDLLDPNAPPPPSSSGYGTGGHQGCNCYQDWNYPGFGGSGGGSDGMRGPHIVAATYTITLDGDIQQSYTQDIDNGDPNPTFVFNGPLANGLHPWHLDVMAVLSNGQSLSGSSDGKLGVGIGGPLSPFGAGWELSDLDPAVPSSVFTTTQVHEDGTATTTFPDGTRKEYSDLGLLTAVVGADGQTEHFSYDDHENLTQITNIDGGVTTFQYVGGYLSSIMEPGGRTLTFDMGSPDNIGAADLLGTTDADGNARSFTYGGPFAHLITQDSWAPYQTTIAYDGSGNGPTAPVSEVALGSVQTVSIVPAESNDGTTALVTDGNGHTTQYVPGGEGTLLALVRPDGSGESWQYNRNNQVTLATDFDGNTTTYQYDDSTAGAGVLTDVHYADGSDESYVYDNTIHKPISYTDRDANTTTWTYSSTGDMLTQTIGTETTQFTWSDGLMASMTDADGNVTDYSYNGSLQQTAVTITDVHGGSRSQTFTYDAAGYVASSTTDVGGEPATTAMVHDGRGDLVSETNPAGDTTVSSYNAVGFVTSTTDGRGIETDYVYDAAANQTEVIDAANTLQPRITLNQYDAAGNLISSTDPDGLATYFQFDVDNRQVGTMDPTGATTTEVLDPNGNVTETIDPDGNYTIAGYDSNGNVTSEQVYNANNTLVTSSSTAFDSLGNARSETDGDGNTVSYIRDQYGNILRKIDPLGTWTYTYDGDNNQTSITDPSGNTTDMTYDDQGNVLSTVVKDADGNVVSRSSATYDDEGNVLTQTDGDGNTVSFTYDGDGRMLTQTDALGTTSYQYDNDGNRILVTDPDGNTTQTTYDADGNVLSTTLRDVHGNVVSTTGTTYDNDGRVLTETDADGNTVSYTYDNDGRVLTRTDALGTTTYGYDADGNQISVTDPDQHTTTQTFDALGQVLSRTDALGTWTFAFDGNGNQVSETDPDHNTTTETFDAEGHVLTRIDALGTWTYAYDAQGNQTSITDPDSNTTTMTYDAAGRVLSTVVKDANGTVVSHSSTTYDDVGNVLTQTDGDGNTVSFTYDAEGHVLTQTDALGTTHYQYDADGNHILTIDPVGNKISETFDAEGNVLFTWVKNASGDTLSHTSATFDGNGNELSFTDGDGNTGNYTYDAEGHVLTESNALGSTTYGYDANGNQISVTDPDHNTSSETYDAEGHVLTRTDALGTWTYAYDANGNQVSVTDPDGNTVTQTFDAEGHVLTRTDALGTTHYQYDGDGNQIRITDPLGNTTSMTYDADGNVVSTTVKDAGGNIISISSATFDGNGNQLTTTDGDGNAVSYTYNAEGHVLTMTDARGTTHYSYDADGNQISVTDPDGNTVSQTFDGEGRVLTRTDAAGTTTYQYDAGGNQTLITGPDGSTTAMTYNADGNVLSTIVKDAGGNVISSSSATYDGDGNQLTATDGDNHTVSYSYDAEGHVLSVTNALGTTHYSYDADGNQLSVTDPDGNTTSYTYDVAGNVLTVTSPLGTTTNTYDADGNLTSTTDALGRTISYAYDDGRVTSETWSDGNVLTYTYDSDGNLLTATNNAGTYTMTYDAEGNLLTRTDPNGITFTYGYDNDGNVTSIADSQGGLTTMAYNGDGEVTTKTVVASGMTLEVAFTYDANGNVLSETRTQNGEAAGSTQNTYDGNQLTFIVQTDGSDNTIGSFSYSYDTAGQLTSQTVNGLTTSFSYDATGQLTQAGAQGYSYDANGNPTNSGDSVGTDNQLASDGIWNYSYDAVGNLIGKTAVDGSSSWTYGYDNANHLVSAIETDAEGATITSVSYTYDVFGNRLSRTVTNSTGTGTQGFVYDGSTLYADTDSSGTITLRYVADVTGPNTWLARVDAQGSSGSAWLLGDHQGSVTSIVSMSGAGYTNVMYGTFGSVVGLVYNDGSGFTTDVSNAPAVGEVLFQGMYFEIWTGLYHSGNNPGRDDDAVDNRWLQPDTSLSYGSNLYEALNNAPTNGTDPTGHYLIAPDSQNADAWVSKFKDKYNINASKVELSGGRYFINVPSSERSRLSAIRNDNSLSEEYRKNLVDSLTSLYENVVGWGGNSITFTQDTVERLRQAGVSGADSSQTLSPGDMAKMAVEASKQDVLSLEDVRDQMLNALVLRGAILHNGVVDNEAIQQVKNGDASFFRNNILIGDKFVSRGQLAEQMEKLASQIADNMVAANALGLSPELRLSPGSLTPEQQQRVAEAGISAELLGDTAEAPRLGAATVSEGRLVPLYQGQMTSIQQELNQREITRNIVMGGVILVIAIPTAGGAVAAGTTMVGFAGSMAGSGAASAALDAGYQYASNGEVNGDEVANAALIGMLTGPGGKLLGNAIPKTMIAAGGSIGVAGAGQQFYTGNTSGGYYLLTVSSLAVAPSVASKVGAVLEERALIGTMRTSVEQALRSQDFQKALTARNIRLYEISQMSPSQVRKFSTVVGGINTRTGQVAVGAKHKAQHGGLAICAEDIVVEMLGGNPKEILMTAAIRPRLLQILGQVADIPVCPRCQTKYSQSQFMPGTRFD